MRQIEIPVNIEYLRTLKTIADIKAISSLLNGQDQTEKCPQVTRDERLDRSGNNQYHQGMQNSCKGVSLFCSEDIVLIPTFNFTKKQEAIRNLEVQNMFKELGVELI